MLTRLLTAYMFLVTTGLICAQSTPSNIDAKKFLLPITKNGKKHMLIRGRTGSISGMIANVTGTQITLFRELEDGGQVLIFSPRATFNRSTRIASSSKRVNIRMQEPDKKSGKVIIDGVGFDLDSKAQFLSIRSNVSVRITREGQGGLPGMEKKDAKKPVEPGKIHLTVITSKNMTYNLKTEVITFRGDVKGVDYGPDNKALFHLFSDAMEVHRKESRFEKVVAKGNVRLHTHEGKAFGDEAVYTLVDKKMLITGNPKIINGDNEITGAERIHFVQSEERKYFEAEGGDPTFRFTAKDHRKSLLHEDKSKLPKDQKKQGAN